MFRSVVIAGTTDDIRTCMERNYFAAAYIAHAVMKQWLAKLPTQNQTRHLIFTASTAAFIGFRDIRPMHSAKQLHVPWQIRFDKKPCSTSRSKRFASTAVFREPSTRNNSQKSRSKTLLS
ncbi:hypothetical protein DPV78_012398 [Talaromyces pinophilus]|nr:hypothetical protein DPV78_012398 [Talaromyces pinophilus]